MARAEKELVDYQTQVDRPFEHEDRLKKLLARQAELNSQLDVDKGDQQRADYAPGINEDMDKEKAASNAIAGSGDVAKMAEAYMRASGTSIREGPIVQRCRWRWKRGPFWRGEKDQRCGYAMERRMPTQVQERAHCLGQTGVDAFGLGRAARFPFYLEDDRPFHQTVQESHGQWTIR